MMRAGATPATSRRSGRQVASAARPPIPAGTPASARARNTRRICCILPSTGFAGASSANAPTRRPSGGSFVAGSPGDDSPDMIGSRSPTSGIPPWSLPSRSSGCTPTACIASQLSLTLPARRLLTWSIVFSSAIQLVRPSGSAQLGRAGWLHAIKRRWRKLGANWQLIGSTNLRVNPCAGPEPAFLCDRIACDETELRAVALGPLEIVKARPVKIAADRDAGIDGAKHRSDVREYKLWPSSIIPVRDAIFSHVDWQSFFLERTQHPVQTLGVQLPVQVRAGCSNREHAFAE